jgi:hypothetical protein
LTKANRKSNIFLTQEAVMLLVVSVLLVLCVGLTLFNMRIKSQRDYLNNVAGREHDMAQVALELLYEGSAKHNNLTFEDTVSMVDSIRQEPNVIARQALAERIMGVHSQEPESKKRIGFS